MRKLNNQAAQRKSQVPAKSGSIPLPADGFKPSTVRSGVSAQLRDFFTRAWEQYQEVNPDACIRNTPLVRSLRVQWYPYLEKAGFNKNTCSQVAGEWYKSDAVFRNPQYIRDEEVLAKLNG